ncbi:MAG: hypothetical protein QNJ34_02595 [Xenococcaceae cyanobacterium MO_188.B29]|nr:hypothetical protein [Xenococcaceae cyanobacterium MO_188.B29]
MSDNYRFLKSKISKLLPPLSKNVYWCGSIALVIAILLFSLWYQVFTFQLGFAVLATLISYVWMSILFISTVNLWQEKQTKRLGLASYIILLSTTLSGFWMLVFYPAVMSIDALSHWQQALNNQYHTWHPPALAMLMHLTQYFVNNPSLFSFIQGAFFWGAILYLIRQVVTNNRLFLINSSLIILLPPLWLYSNATVSNTWMATFTLLTIAFLIKSIRHNSKTLFTLSIIALSLGVMFRRETIFFILIVLPIYLLLFGRNSSIFKRVRELILILLIIILPGKIIELSPNVSHDVNPTAHGLLNQYVGTVVNSENLMDESEIDREKLSIEQEFGTGTWQRLLDGYSCFSAGYIVWGNVGKGVPAAIGEVPKEQNSFIVSKIVQTAFRHPLGYLKHQGCYFAYLLQVQRKISSSYKIWGVFQSNPNIKEQRTQLGIEFQSKLPSIKAWQINLVNNILDSPILSFLFRHYVFLGFSAIFLIVGFSTHRIELIIPSLFSLIYPFGYLIVAPDNLWRYLFPSYLCSWICLLVFLNTYILRKFVTGKKIEEKISNQ